MATPSNLRISVAKYRVAIFGGDSRVHALEGSWVNEDFPEEIDVTTFVSNEGSTARLVAALRAGGCTHVIMLTRWMGHSNYKTIKQAAESNNVKILHWQHGLGKLEDELVNIIVGKTETDPETPEPEEAETAPPVQLLARNAGLTVACFQARHAECVYKDKPTVRCGCACHPKVELPIEPAPPPPFECTRDQVFEVMRLDNRESWRVSEIAELLMAKESAHFKVVRSMVKDLVQEGALIKMDHEHVALPKPAPVPTPEEPRYVVECDGSPALTPMTKAEALEMFPQFPHAKLYRLVEVKVRVRVEIDE